MLRAYLRSSRDGNARNDHDRCSNSINRLRHLRNRMLQAAPSNDASTSLLRLVSKSDRLTKTMNKTAALTQRFFLSIQDVTTVMAWHQSLRPTQNSLHLIVKKQRKLSDSVDSKPTNSLIHRSNWHNQIQQEKRKRQKHTTPMKLYI